MVHRGDARWEMNNAGVEGKTGWPSNQDEKHGETHLSQVSAFSVSSLELQRVNALPYRPRIVVLPSNVARNRGLRHLWSPLLLVDLPEWPRNRRDSKQGIPIWVWSYCKTNVRAIIPPQRSKSWGYVVRKQAPKKAGAKLLQEKATFLRIVARALMVASEEGLAALTIGRLAKELNMSKSGVFAHFLAKEALELATIERAREVFVSNVLPSTELSQAGITKVWSLCDDWLKHIEQGIFPGNYFFTGAF